MLPSRIFFKQQHKQLECFLGEKLVAMVALQDRGKNTSDEDFQSMDREYWLWYQELLTSLSSSTCKVYPVRSTLLLT